MNLKINKKVAIVMAVLILSLAMASTAFAADNYKNLKAWFGEIKIFHNNTPVQLKDKPFIVDGTTYLPIRSVSEMLGMDITWDGTNRHIGINDKPGTSYNDMLNKFIMQEIKIVELEAKVKDLEAKLKVKEEEAKVTTLSDLEKQLNKDHDRYSNVDFDITLYGTKDKPEVRVYVDSYSNNSRWDSLTSTQKDRYLQDIVNDILKEFKDARITGYVEEGRSSGKLATFTVSNRGIVSVSTSSGNTGRYDLIELEGFLTRNYKTYGITDVRLTENLYQIDLTLYVDEYNWRVLGNIEQKRVLERIYLDIYDYAGYNYTASYGEILDNRYSNTPINTFRFDRNGYVTLY